MAKAEATVEELVAIIQRRELGLPEMKQCWALPFANASASVFHVRENA
jgi:hypothetical protein